MSFADNKPLKDDPPKTVSPATTKPKPIKFLFGLRLHQHNIQYRSRNN